MDSFFGIGAPELILILVIAGMVMGPERIGRTARWLGRTSAQLQSISRGFIRQLNTELDAGGNADELKGAWRDMQDLRRQIDDLKGELTAVAGGAFKEGEKALTDVKKEVERTIAPPSLTAATAEESETAGDPSPAEKLKKRVEELEAADAPPPPLKLPERIEVADDPEE